MKCTWRQTKNNRAKTTQQLCAQGGIRAKARYLGGQGPWILTIVTPSLEMAWSHDEVMMFRRFRRGNPFVLPCVQRILVYSYG